MLRHAPIDPPTGRVVNVVLTNDAPDIAGGENYVLHLATGLRSRGHDVSIVPLEAGELADAARRADFRTLPFPFASGGRELALGLRLARLLAPLAPDIVHSNANADRTIGALAARRLGCGSVASIHSCLPIRHNLTHALRNRFLIDRFTPVGYATREIMIAHDRIAPERIEVVHIGIPAETAMFSSSGRARIRAEFGFGERDVVVGTLSRLVAFKGHAVLLDAVGRLHAAAPELRVLVAGDGELRDELRARRSDGGLDGVVRFAGRRSDVADVLSAFDIVAQPSIDRGGETFPVSLLEAMAVARPIVASDVGDIAHIVDDGATGLLVPPSDPAALADALGALLGDTERRATMGVEARRRFLARFTLETMIDAMERVYADVLRIRRGS